MSSINDNANQSSPLKSPCNEKSADDEEDVDDDFDEENDQLKESSLDDLVNKLQESLDNDEFLGAKSKIEIILNKTVVNVSDGGKVGNIAGKNQGHMASEIGKNAKNYSKEVKKKNLKEKQEKWPDDLFARYKNDVREIIFIIAIAALDGLPSAMIERSAIELSECLTSQIDDVSEDEAVSKPFQLSSRIAGILKEARVERYSSVPWEGIDVPPSERLRYKKRHLAHDVIRYAWRELDGSVDLKKGIIQWLKQMGSASNLELRIAAGQTAGLLSFIDFDVAFEELLSPWFRMHDIESLDAIDSMLTFIVAEDENWAKWTNSFITKWSHGKEGVHGLIAAKVLAEGAYGHESPEIAFQALAAMFYQKRHLALRCATGAYIIWFSRSDLDAVLTLKEVSKLSVSRYDELAEASLDLIVVSLMTASRVKYHSLQRKELPPLLGAIAATESSERIEAVVGRLINDAIMRSQSSRALGELRRLFYEAMRRNDLARPVSSLVQAIFNAGSYDEQTMFVYHVEGWLEEARERGDRIPTPLSQLA